MAKREFPPQAMPVIIEERYKAQLGYGVEWLSEENASWLAPYHAPRDYSPFQFDFNSARGSIRKDGNVVIVRYPIGNSNDESGKIHNIWSKICNTLDPLSKVRGNQKEELVDRKEPKHNDNFWIGYTGYDLGWFMKREIEGPWKHIYLTQNTLCMKKAMLVNGDHIIFYDNGRIEGITMALGEEKERFQVILDELSKLRTEHDPYFSKD